MCSSSSSFCCSSLGQAAAAASNVHQCTHGIVLVPLTCLVRGVAAAAAAAMCCSYVTLRLLGESADRHEVAAARNWVSKVINTKYFFFILFIYVILLLSFIQICSHGGVPDM